VELVEQIVEDFVGKPEQIDLIVVIVEGAVGRSGIVDKLVLVVGNLVGILVELGVELGVEAELVGFVEIGIVGVVEGNLVERMVVEPVEIEDLYYSIQTLPIRKMVVVVQDEPLVSLEEVAGEAHHPLRNHLKVMLKRASMELLLVSLSLD